MMSEEQKKKVRAIKRRLETLRLEVGSLVAEAIDGDFVAARELDNARDRISYAVQSLEAVL